MDSIACTADDKRMRILATRTLSGPAGKFACRLITQNPNIRWLELRRQLRDRYSDLKDPYCAREKLQKVRQKKGELIQNYSERLQDVASEVFDDPSSADSQRTLVEVFQKGVSDDRLARALIRKKFSTLPDAVKFASEEQQTDRTFELCRGKLDVEEPMEIDVVRSDPQNDRIERLEKCLSDVGSKLDQLTKHVVKNQRANQVHQPSNQTQPQQKRQYQAKPQNQSPFQRHQPPNQWQRRPQNQPPGAQYQHQQAFQPRAEPNQPPQRYQWTPDNRPICAFCQKIGHVQRVCRAKQAALAGQQSQQQPEN